MSGERRAGRAQSSTPASVDVVIVGGGPVGVAAGTLLTQFGITCLILERHSDIYPQPRAVHCDDEVCRILDRVGIYQEFAKISRSGLGMRVLDHEMRVIDQTYTKDRSAHGFPPTNMYDQPELERLLRAHFIRQPGASLRSGAEVTAVSQHQGGARVSFKDRKTGDLHNVGATYVLGADGANSMVRAAIGATMKDLHFEQRWLVIDIDTHADLQQWEGLHQVCSPQRAASYMRVSDTRYRWEFRLLDGETAENYQNLSDIMPLISPWTQEVPADQLQLVRVADYTFRARLADRWRQGNVFILGDAAHTTPPFIGQGLGAGLRDAMNLSWKLAGVINGSLTDAALDTYEQERKPHVRSVIRAAISLGWVMTASGQTAHFFRGVVFPQLFRMPRMQALAIKGITPKLHRSSLIVKSSGRGDLAGTMCPNPIEPQGLRIDVVKSNRFAFISSTELGESQTCELERRGAVAIAAPPGSELADWLVAGRAAAAVIRPDSVVMQAGDDLQGLIAAVPVFTVTRAAETE